MTGTARLRRAAPFLLLLALAATTARAGLVDQITSGVTGAGAVEARCHKGDARQCTSAGNMYRNGFQQVAKDLGKAIELYRLGCAGGDARACHALYELGFADAHGKKTPLNLPRAVELFTAGCDGVPTGAYSGAACHELGLLYLKGKPVKRDDARGVDLLRRGCEGTSQRACRDLGDVLLAGKQAARDVPGAVAAYTKACEGKKGEPRACKELGLLYDEGKAVKRDVAAAERYLAGGCAFPKQYGSACYALAMLYATDLPGLKSDQEITDMLHVACERAASERSGAACVAAAERHANGKGASPDQNMIANLYSRGCQLKDAKACRLSCEFHCNRGQPHACTAIKSGKIPLGVANCFKR